MKVDWQRFWFKFAERYLAGLMSGVTSGAIIYLILKNLL